MGHIRLVHPKHWERGRARFGDLAFKSAGDAGMSIFESDCATARSGLICEHIDHFYKGVGGEPPIFLIVEDDEWPEGYSLKHVESDTGDDCHREVEGVTDKRIKKALMKRPWSDYMICAPDGLRPLTQQDIDAFLATEDAAIEAAVANPGANE